MRGFATYETRWGIGAVVFTAVGLAAVILPVANDRLLEEEIAGKYGPVAYEESLGKELTSTLALYFNGARVHFAEQLDYGEATQFEQQVYEKLKAIPYGECVTYKDLAAQCGRPRAARAVGNAMAKNPLPVVIPCHRVVKSDGGIGGWSGKPGWKERLLAIEAIRA